MDPALAMMSHLRVADVEQLESRFDRIQDPNNTTERNLSHKLSGKLLHCRLSDRMRIADRYIDYTSQAHKLLLESDEWNVECAWHLRDMALRYVHIPTGIPEYDEAEEELNRAAEWLELQLDEKLVRLQRNAATTRALYAICMDRIALFENGEATEIRDLIQDDDRVMEDVRQCNVEDVFAQETVSEVWEHLENNEERMFRLRLILVMERERRDVEIEMAKERQQNQMTDLLNGIELMNFSEPMEVTEAREQAVAVSKAELKDLLVDMCNLNIERKAAFTQVLPRVVLKIGNGRIQGYQI